MLSPGHELINVNMISLLWLPAQDRTCPQLFRDQGKAQGALFIPAELFATGGF